MADAKTCKRHVDFFFRPCAECDVDRRATTAPLPSVLAQVANARKATDHAIADQRAALLEAVVHARLNHYTLQEIADACGMSEAGVRKMLRVAGKR